MVKEYYLSILSGRQRGYLAALIKPTLSAFTYPYSAVLIIRNALYENGIVRSERLPVKVISVGNITTGGTGKTPLVEFLANYLLHNNKKVAILSRGYGGGSPSKENEDNINDECLALRENLQGVLVLAGKDRVKNGEKAIRDDHVDVLILDDGFQHLRLKRDLDIVVIDALNPFGGENLIPRGSLREPLKNLARAGLFIISHCNQSNEQNIKSIYKRINHINSHAPVCESIHRPFKIENITDGSIFEPGWLNGKRVYGLSAIGNPESFASTLMELGADLIKHKKFHDHHNYKMEEIGDVVSEAKELGADAIIVTQKDIVKIRNMDIKDFKILSLKIEIEITKGIEFFEETVDSTLNLDQNN